MSENLQSQVGRREFLQAGALAAASTAVLAQAAPGQDAKADEKSILPTRKLGRTGVDVTMLNVGTGAWKNNTAATAARLLRIAYANGIRYIDTADAYRTEPFVAQFLAGNEAARKDTFVVTKQDKLKTGKQMIESLDDRLKTLKLDSVDMFFIHGLGDHHEPDECLEIIRGKEFRAAAEQMKKSGKAKFVGFSCHHPRKAEFITAAAEAGWVDAIMLSYTPWAGKDHPINKALDAAHEKGIGLISMKQLAGSNQPKFLEDVVNHVPSLKGSGLTGYQMLLQAIWSDERIASCCVSMKTSEQMLENVAAARRYKPLTVTQLDEIRDLFLASRPTMCANCDGRCAAAAGTDAPLGDLARFYTYHQHHGLRTDARRQYRELPEAARDWRGADLAAAQAACPSHLDFASILPAVDRHLA